ncbi:MAG: glycosyltransferase family 4 protein [Candidatus Geothermincolia bacterium]
MNIAIVSPYSWEHPGGVNNHIEGLARQLSLRGHAVTVIAPDGGASLEDANFISAGRSVALPANGSIARIAIAPGTGGRVRGALTSGSFDVVHVHEPMVPLVSTSAVKAAGCRVVGTFHAAGEGRSVPYWLAKNLMPGVSRGLNARIAVSEPARALASRYLPGFYEVIPNGVDISRFKPAEGVERGGKAGPEILFVGRNEQRKGLAVLLEAFPEVCASVEGCTLKVIGSGFTQEGVADLLPSDLRGRLSVTGFVSNEDLPGHYAEADVFCSPALGGESFGIVLIEAMASGTPVVASDIPGYSAVVEQAGGGLLFNCGNAHSLAGGLARVLREDSLRLELRRNGLRGVEQFSWEVLAPRLESVYAAPTS